MLKVCTGVVSAGPPAFASSVKLTLTMARPAVPFGVKFNVPFAATVGWAENMLLRSLVTVKLKPWVKSASPSLIALAQLLIVCGALLPGDTT